VLSALRDRAATVGKDTTPVESGRRIQSVNKNKPSEGFGE